MLYRDIGLDRPVSALSLGSWNTFSRLSRRECAGLLSLAVERGINLFDVGYYWDKPDTEEAFAAAMRTAGLRREQYMLALKLWLWNYPEQSLAEQAKASLRRLDVDHVDVVMVSRPTPEVDFAAFCEEVDALVRAGIARAWGVTNWEPEQIEAACAVLNGRSPCLDRKSVV